MKCLATLSLPFKDIKNFDNIYSTCISLRLLRLYKVTDDEEIIQYLMNIIQSINSREVERDIPLTIKILSDIKIKTALTLIRMIENEEN